MQSPPANTILQLMGQSVATPASAPRTDAAVQGNDAFAAALQLLLSGAPAAIPGDDTSGSVDLATLLLSIGQSTTPGSAPGSTQGVAIVPMALPGGETTSAKVTVALPPSAADASLLASLMPVMPSLRQDSTGSTQPDSDAPAATDNPNVNLNAVGAATSMSGHSPLIDPALMAGLTHAGWAMAPLPMTSQPVSSVPSSPNGVQLTADSTGSFANLTPRQFVTVALPTQPHGLIVSDLPANQSNDDSGEATAKLPNTGTPLMSTDNGIDPKLLQTRAVSKSSSAQPAALPVTVDLNQPAHSAGFDSTNSTNTNVPASPVPIITSPVPNNTGRVLTAKILNTPDVPNVSPEARVLTSKMSELGVQSLSIRQGGLQSKSADRLQSLSFMDESMIARSVAGKPAPILAPKSQEPSPRIAGKLTSSDEQLCRKDDPAPAPVASRAVESAAKASAPAQDASMPATEAPKQPVAEGTEAAPASAQRFVIEDAKPIRVPGQITVRMEPKDLGRMTIDLQTGPDGIIGRLRFASDAVRATVERDISQLHRALSDAGVRVERLEIVGVASTSERSGFSSQTPQDHQAPHRDSPGQGKNGEPKDNSNFNNRERGQRHAPVWNTNQKSAWMTMTSLASGLNLVA